MTLFFKTKKNIETYKNEFSHRERKRLREYDIIFSLIIDKYLYVNNIWVYQSSSLIQT